MSEQKMQRRPRPKTVEDFLGQAAEEQVVETNSPDQRDTAPSKKKKLKAFNLPIELIARIEKEAEIKTAGNASALATRIFNDYFEVIDRSR